MKKKYFLFLDKKIEITDYYRGGKRKENKYNLSSTTISNDGLYLPYCKVLYEDIFDDGHYEYIMGSYNEYSIWETNLSFVSDKRLIVEGE